VGIRWRTGATEELVVYRSVARRTPAAAIELVRRLADRSDEELVAELAGAGLSTGGGRPFNVAAVRWIRYAHAIPAPPPPAFLAPGELTVAQVAARLGVADGVIYQWISKGKLDARRGVGGRLCVPFSREVEETCQHRLRRSTPIRPRTQEPAAGCAV
jgi:excisionase family DNA binding protein